MLSIIALSKISKRGVLAMPMNVTLILAFIAAVTCTVLSLIFIVPKSKKETLPVFFKFVHDLFNFKILIVEMILKTLYIFLTLFFIGLGFFMLFSAERSFFGGYRSFAGYGLLIMIIAPVVVRIVYEFLMLSIIMVKNIIEINNRAKGKSDSLTFGTGEYKIKRPEFIERNRFNGADAAPYTNTPGGDGSLYKETSFRAPEAAAEPVAKVPNFAFCTQCGTRYDKNEGGCPKCGR